MMRQLGADGFPFRLAIARGQEMMGADLHRHRREIVQLAQQLLDVAGGEVGFVITEPGINGLVGADRLAEIDRDGDGRGLGPRLGEGRPDARSIDTANIIGRMLPPLSRHPALMLA
jgi:hypothetical protein